MTTLACIQNNSKTFHHRVHFLNSSTQPRQKMCPAIGYVLNWIRWYWNQFNLVSWSVQKIRSKKETFTNNQPEMRGGEDTATTCRRCMESAGVSDESCVPKMWDEWMRAHQAIALLLNTHRFIRFHHPHCHYLCSEGKRRRQQWLKKKESPKLPFTTFRLKVYCISHHFR